MDPPDAPTICSQSKCSNPPTPGLKTCESCRTNNTRAKREARAKRKLTAENEESRKRARPDASNTRNGVPEEAMDSDNEAGENLMTNKHVDFRGTYQTPEDPLITDKEHVQMTVHEIWKVTGYRFRVKENKAGETGHRTRLWCCQDADRKQKARPSSRLRVSSLDGNVAGERKISISLQHHDAHVPYFDVAMPPEAAAIIREGVEWSTPVAMVGKVQALFPHVTASQIHSAWSEMSEVLWKRDKQQLPSAQILLEELGDDVDVLDLKPPEGVQQVAWVMKKVMEPLQHDNAGFPLSYCLLSTADSIDIGKRKAALEAWAQVLRDEYGVNPVFVHVDKDMAEIGMIRSLCLWHLKHAVRTRLEKRKLSTTPYNVQRAHAEYPFIDLKFKPAGRADPTEFEGGVLESPTVPVTSTPAPRPHAVTIKLPPTQRTALDDTTNLSGSAAAPMDVDEENEEEEGAQRIFCPVELREDIVSMMERHLNAHPLIPGYSHPSPEGIREWAVKQMYTFCVNNDLPEVWAYLWENWYRRGRWELWARAEHPEIPRLKTTMMVESHWRRIKRDFLHHFHKPRLDLLVWILVTKLAPRYYRRLDIMLGDTGRYRELPSWRKDFKAEWKRCREVPITLPLNEKYRPDPYRWVSVHPVHPVFFLEVTRNRTTPFWPHPSLRPLDGPPAPSTAPVTRTVGTSAPHDDSDGGDDSDEELVDVRARATYDERLTSTLGKVRDFCDAMEYQRQFHDTRMLDTLDREGASFFRLIDQCLMRERRENPTRSAAPNTWDRSTANAMFYRTRPVPSERDT
ncbi:hypothetical protein DFH06DRAFT_1268903 [Mycena polygramma]|nr:hypothetical protein DFH06DRAFT_1268903 [Mycena polygramma]